MDIDLNADLDQFFDGRFASEACRAAGHVSHLSQVRDFGEILATRAEQQASNKSSKAMLDREGKYLIFTLDDQEYGFDLLSIKEIIGMVPLRSIPRAPEFLKGVINLRGVVIPVVDLRSMFGLQPVEYGDRTCMVILDIATADRNVYIGVIVDSVSHVETIKADDIESSPSFGLRQDLDYVAAFAKKNDPVRILLEVDSLFSGRQKEMIESVGGER